MGERKVHGLYRYEQGVGVPYCATPGRNLYVTASWEVVNCKKCLNALEQHNRGKYAM